MLQPAPSLSPRLDFPAEPRDTGFLDFQFLLRLFHRGKFVILISVAVAAIAGLIFLYLTPATYKATAEVVIDPRRLDLFQKDSLFTGAPVDVGTIESNVQLVTSEKIVSAVVDKLGLVNSPEFNGERPLTAFQKIKQLLNMLPFVQAEPASRSGVVDNIQNRLEARRAGLSYVIDLSFLSLDAATAAQVVNEVAQTYVKDISNVRLQAMQDAGVWLESRLKELGTRAMEAEQDLLAFRGEQQNLDKGQVYAKLRELESNATTYRTLYDNFLQRYMQTLQQQSFPAVEARVATLANVPNEKFGPKVLLTMAAFVLIGCIVGIAIVIARALLDRSIRTEDELTAVTGVRSLGLLPKISEERSARTRARAAADDAERVFEAPGTMAAVLKNRRSHFTETIRSIKVAVDYAQPGYRSRIIGVTSALPGEGKSTVATNLALSMAQGGARVLLIDADLRHPSLSMALAPKASRSLIDVLRLESALPEAVWRNAATPNLEFLPATMSDDGEDSCDLVGGERMQRLLAQETTGSYRYIIIDLPPITPVVDIRALANLVDGVVLITRWGETSARALRKALNIAPMVSEKLIGAVINQVDIDRLKYYDDVDSSAFVNHYYTGGQPVSSKATG